MRTVKVFGVWNIVLLVITGILFGVSLYRKDYWFVIPLGIIGLSELLMGFVGATSPK